MNKNEKPLSFQAINLACGAKLCFEPGWLNADHVPSSDAVKKVNLLKSLPYSDNSFNVVYHSQFIEHISPEMGSQFVQECFRILKPGGILRIVTPDLENQVKEYLICLNALKDNSTDEQSLLRYQWMRLEMLDQLLRHESGGEMMSFIKKRGWKIKDFLVDRLGRSGTNLVSTSEFESRDITIIRLLQGMRSLKERVLRFILPHAYKVGRFRISGESHLCMYDEFLLSKVLRSAGFLNVARLDALNSQIPDWKKTLLDVDTNNDTDNTSSLFMEATKPD